MENFINIITQNYNVFITVLALLLMIWGLYNKIKFLCLEKASKMVVDAEGHSELSGKEKFSLCILWINDELPKVFKNSLFQSILEEIIEFAYKTSFGYMKKYVKRKTGFDITEIIEQIKTEEKQEEK